MRGRLGWCLGWAGAIQRHNADGTSAASATGHCLCARGLGWRVKSEGGVVVWGSSVACRWCLQYVL